MIPAIICAPVLWLVYFVVLDLSLIVVGVPLVCVLARRRAWIARGSQIYPGVRVLAWRSRLAWLWGNEQDGVTGANWFRMEHRNKSDRWCAFQWSALRNPCNNLRFVPIINPVIDPSRIGSIGNSWDPNLQRKQDREIGRSRSLYWCYTWQGIFSGFWLIWNVSRSRHLELRIGWKLIPRDQYGIDNTDYRKPRCPFGIIFHPWRKS